MALVEFVHLESVQAEPEQGVVHQMKACWAVGQTEFVGLAGFVSPTVLVEAFDLVDLPEAFDLVGLVEEVAPA